MSNILLTDNVYYTSYDFQFCIDYKKTTDYRSMPKSHYHDHYEIFYLVSGERYYLIRDRLYHLKKGDLIFVNVFDFHRAINCGKFGYERYVISFKPAFISNILDTIQDVDLFSQFKNTSFIARFDMSEQPFVERILSYMLNEFKQKMQYSDQVLKISLVELLFLIYRKIQESKPESIEFLHPKYKKVYEVIKYIDNNFTSKITLSEISEIFDFSPNYFCKLFKEITGISFIEYLNTLRIKKAKKLLTDTTLNITEIAFSVGFESTTHFGRVFKAMNKQSPLEYRKMSRETELSKHN